MSDSQIHKLDELGFVWDPNIDKWEAGYSALKVYKEREGHCKVPNLYCENSFRLGQWVSVQRLSKSNLSIDRISRLNELDFIWSPRKSK